MKKTKAVLYFLMVFFAGALTSSWNEWLQPITTVEITNVSAVPIKHIDITFIGLAEQQGRIGKNLKPGETVVFQWITQSEASYRLRVTFDDGTEVVGGAGYIGRGDTIKDAVDLKSIMSRRPMLPVLPLYAAPSDTTYTDKPSSRLRKGGETDK
jgi:hypothetical protein